MNAVLNTYKIVIQLDNPPNIFNTNFLDLNRQLIKEIEKTEADAIIKKQIIGFIDAHGKRSLSETSLNLIGDIFT